MPQLPSRAIHGLLVGSDGWTLVMSPSLVTTLSWMTLAGAGGIADNLEGDVIFVMVHTHLKHGGICIRGRDDDPLSFTFQVSPSLSMVVKTLVDSTTYSAPASPHLMLV